MINSDYPLNENVLKDCEEILKDYDIGVSLRINQDYEKTFLTDSTPNKCRFCGKSYPDVRFEHESHTIPEFMGNKKLFSKFECDACNKDYFCLFENEMANFMLPHNTLSGTRVKKNKIPKYNLKGNPIIKNNPDKIIITGVPDSILLAENNNSFDLTIKIPTYIPEYIYRCLIKIGLSIIPEDYLTDYKGTIRWLMDKNMQSNMKPYLLFSTYPYSIQLKDIFCALLVRKEECEKNVPHTILFLSYKSFTFQVYLPYSFKERLNTKLKAIPFIHPTALDLNKNNEGYRAFNLIDLSSREKKNNETITLKISGEMKSAEI